MIRFGLCPLLPLPSTAAPTQPWQQAALAAQTAEYFDFDLVAFAAQPGSAFANPLLSAAGLAGLTSRIQLGVLGLGLNVLNITRFASDATQLDMMLGGRLLLGVEFESGGRADLPSAERSSGDALRGLRESLARCRRSAELISMATRTPRTLPIYATAQRAADVARVARYADGWIADGSLPLAQLRELAEVFRSEAARHGRNPEIVLLRDCYCAASAHEAQALCSGNLCRSNTPSERCILGTPEECCEQIARCIDELGLSSLIVRVGCPPDLAYDALLESIQVFGEAVIPRFRSPATPLATCLRPALAPALA